MILGMVLWTNQTCGSPTHTLIMSIRDVFVGILLKRLFDYLGSDSTSDAVSD